MKDLQLPIEQIARSKSAFSREVDPEVMLRDFFFLCSLVCYNLLTTIAVFALLLLGVDRSA